MSADWRCGAHPKDCQYVTCQRQRGHEDDHLAQSSDRAHRWTWTWPLTGSQRRTLKRQRGGSDECKVGGPHVFQRLDPRDADTWGRTGLACVECGAAPREG